MRIGRPKPGIPRGLAAAALAAAALAVAGCAEDEEDLEPLYGGTARGPGFALPLGSDWRVSKDPKPKHVPKGTEAFVETVVVAGVWARPAEGDEDVSVSVVMEQASPDTSWEVLAQGAREVGDDDSNLRLERQGISLDGAEAAYIALSTGPDGELEKRSLYARRGSLLYTISAQSTGADPGELERVRDQVAARWKWKPLTAAEESRIARVTREVDGTGYRAMVPPGWRGVKAEAVPEVAGSGADTYWAGYADADLASHVAVVPQPSPYSSLERSLGRVERGEREFFEPVTSFRRGPRMTVGGEPAVSFDLTVRADGKPRRYLDVLTIHEGTLFRIALGTKPARHGEDRRALLAALRDWRWE